MGSQTAGKQLTIKQTYKQIVMNKSYVARLNAHYDIECTFSVQQY